jgi:predicted metalloprotease with PDZ domain
VRPFRIAGTGALPLSPTALVRALFAALLLVVTQSLAAQPLRIAYRVAMPDPASHLYEVALDVNGLRGATLPLQMPVWSPGRYAKMDFARNVQEFRATDADGRPLRWDKTDGSRWVVQTGGARAVRLRYRVFANQLSGTFSVLDTAHANWNGASLFLYVEGHKPTPVTLDVEPPSGWQIVNGDTRRANQTHFRFENYDRLIDTPTEVAPAVLLDSFVVDGKRYRTMVHHNGAAPADARRRFVQDVEKIVRYENSVFGPPPLEQYTFLFNIGYPGGDGMEHLYSTQIVSSRAWADSIAVLPGLTTAAHEYFHVWNVKRVRPAALGPFDYTRELYQPSLWVAEGWTQYYGMSALGRAGIVNRDAFYATMAGLMQINLTAPGRKEVSARMASFHAPFWDGAAQPQPNNGSQTFFSYYTKGAGLALYLDLFLRAKSGNARTLDDVFNALKRRTWDAPKASYYLQGRGYTERDVELAASEVAGEDLHPWFERYVGGTDDVDYDALLARAGLRMLRSGDVWKLEEIPDATPAQRVVREGWATGRRG